MVFVDEDCFEEDDVDDCVTTLVLARRDVVDVDVLFSTYKKRTI